MASPGASWMSTSERDTRVRKISVGVCVRNRLVVSLAHLPTGLELCFCVGGRVASSSEERHYLRGVSV